MKKFLKARYIILLIIFILWGLPFLKCEFLTLLHAREFDFKKEMEEHTMLSSEPEWFRIMSYNDEFAEIYYIDEGFAMGNILSFKKINNEWKYDEWKRTMWTTLGGTADEFVWPYFWHRLMYL